MFWKQKLGRQHAHVCQLGVVVFVAYKVVFQVHVLQDGGVVVNVATANFHPIMGRNVVV